MGQTDGRSRGVGSKPRKASERRDETRLFLRMFVHFATCMYCNRLQFTRSFVCRSAESTTHALCELVSRQRVCSSARGKRHIPRSWILATRNHFLKATLTVRGYEHGWLLCEFFARWLIEPNVMMLFLKRSALFFVDHGVAGHFRYEAIDNTFRSLFVWFRRSATPASSFLEPLAHNTS